MRCITGLVIALASLLGAGTVPAAAQTGERVLHLQFDADGRVTLRAQQVTPREILAEWARLCGCHLVNADRLRGDRVEMPLLFERQPQSVVLRSLLRPAAGYILTPRRAGAAGPSEFETIYIVPTSNPTTGAVAAAPPPMPMPMPVAISTPGSPDNEIPPVPQITPQPASTPAAEQPARPATPGSPTTGLPSVFVPIVPVPSNPFTAPAPTRGGGPATPTPAPTNTPGQPATLPPGGTVGANP